MTVAAPVLILRPEGRGEELAAALAGHGMTPFSYPLVRFVAGPDLARMPAALAPLSVSDLLIAVSPAVATWVASIPAAQWPECSRLAVGPGTAQALGDVGLSGFVAPADACSEGLLALPVCQNGAGRRVVLLKGVTGRPLIADTLVARGFAVDAVRCYDRQPLPPSGVDLDQWMQANVAIAVLTSVEALDIFMTHSNNRHQQWLRAMTWVVVSERVATAVHGRTGAEHVDVAGAADVASLLTAVCRSRRTRS